MKQQPQQPVAQHDYRLVKPDTMFRCVKCGGTMKEAKPTCRK